MDQPVSHDNVIQPAPAATAETLVDGTYADYLAAWQRAYAQKFQHLVTLEQRLVNALKPGKTPPSVHVVWQETITFLEAIHTWTTNLVLDIGTAEMWKQYDSRFAGTEVTDFLTLHVALPTAEFILSERNQFLLNLAQHLRQRYTHTLALLDQLLDLSQLTAPPNTAFNLSAVPLLQTLDDTPAPSFTDFETGSRQRYDAFAQPMLAKLVPAEQAEPIRQHQLHVARDELTRHFQADQTRWSAYFNGEAGEWRVLADLASLKFEAAIHTCTALTSLHHTILDQFTSAVTFASDQFEQAQTTATSAENLSPTRTAQTLRETKSALIPTLQTKAMPRLQHILVDAELAETLQTCASRILAESDTLADEYTIFTERQLDEPRRAHITNTRLIKQGIQATAQQLYAINLQEQVITAEKLFDVSASRLSEIEINAESLFDAAEAQLRRGQPADQKALALPSVQTGLDRAKRDLAALATTLTTFYTTTAESLTQTVTDFIHTVDQFLDRGDLGRAGYNAYVQSLSFRDKSGYRAHQLLQWLKHRAPTVYNGVINLGDSLRDNVSRVQRATGLETISEGDEGRLVQYLTSSDEHIEALPYLYRRLFQPRPLTDPRFFAARAEEIGRLEAELKRWQEGMSASAALIGERGSGVSTLLNIASLKVFEGRKVIRIDMDGSTIFTHEGLLTFLQTALVEPAGLPPCDNFDELVEAVENSAEELVIVVENLANVFLRTPSGFDAIERFLQFMLHTQEAAFWLLTCSLYSWNYFDKVFNISQFIQEEVMLNPLPKETIEKVILRRHRVSGYTLQFTPSDRILQSRDYQQITSPIDQQRFLQTEFFKSLTLMSGGNISVAILYWQRSYESFGDGMLTFPAEISFDTTALRKLSSSEQFTLAALLQHEMLSAENHAAVFHQSLNASQMQLESMANRGLLVQKQDMYAVQPLLYRAIVELLETNNILH